MIVVTKFGAIEAHKLYIEEHEKDVSGEGWSSWRVYTAISGHEQAWMWHLLPDSSLTHERAHCQLMRTYRNGKFHFESLQRLTGLGVPE